MNKQHNCGNCKCSRSINTTENEAWCVSQRSDNYLSLMDVHAWCSCWKAASVCDMEEKDAE